MNLSQALDSKNTIFNLYQNQDALPVDLVTNKYIINKEYYDYTEIHNTINYELLTNENEIEKYVDLKDFNLDNYLELKSLATFGLTSKTNFQPFLKAFLRNQTSSEQDDFIDKLDKNLIINNLGTYLLDNNEIVYSYQLKNLEKANYTFFINTNLMNYVIKNKNNSDINLYEYDAVVQNIEKYPSFCDEISPLDDQLFNYEYLENVYNYFMNQSCFLYMTFGYKNPKSFKNLYIDYKNQFLRQYSNEFEKPAIDALNKDLTKKAQLIP